MKILYHMTSPAPRIPGTDAVYQDVDRLRRAFGGGVINLYPFKSSKRFYPLGLYGVHCLDKLARWDRAVDLHHVFFPGLAPFPALRVLKKPIVYSVVARVPAGRRPAIPANVHVVVNNERDRDTLESLGLKDFTFIRPGIDLSGISPSYLPVGDTFTLLAGSPPWVKPQLRQKGYEALLDAVARMPGLRLVCLWRGVLYDEFMGMVKGRAIADRVEVINEKANVDGILRRVHAAVVLADGPGIVKAYPNSLLEALAAGKPVIASGSMPISDYVERNRCGRRVDAINAEAIIDAVKDLTAHYDALCSNALKRGRHDFALEGMLSSYRRLYEGISGRLSAAPVPNTAGIR